MKWLALLALLAGLTLTGCTDDSPECLHYDTQTSWVYSIGTNGVMTPHLVVTTVCTQYAQPSPSHS